MELDRTEGVMDGRMYASSDGFEDALMDGTLLGIPEGNVVG